MRFEDARTFRSDCERLYAMVADIERYPDFLPGWEDARILVRTGEVMEVVQTVRAGPMPVRFRTRARTRPSRALDIQGSDGPFRRLHITWRFRPAEEGCRIELRIEVEVRLGPLAHLIERLFRHQARELLDRFEHRARRLGIIVAD